MICWQSCVPSILSFFLHLMATRAPYLPKDVGMGFIGAGCVQPNNVTFGDRTLMARARLRLIFSPTLPIVKAEWSLRDFPSAAGRSLRPSAWKIVRCTSFWTSWDFAWFNTAEITVSARLWNFLFRATKSVSQLISASAAWFPSTVTVISPWLVLRSFSLAAWVQPYCCACSFSHFSAWSKEELRDSVVSQLELQDACLNGRRASYLIQIILVQFQSFLAVCKCVASLLAQLS